MWQVLHSQRALDLMNFPTVRLQRANSISPNSQQQQLHMAPSADNSIGLLTRRPSSYHEHMALSRIFPFDQMSITNVFF